MSMIDTSSEEQERERVRQVLDGFPLPPEIADVTIEMGNDSTGDPALWLHFNLKTEIQIKGEQITRLSRFIGEVQSSLLQSGISRFPYAYLDEAA